RAERDPVGSDESPGVGVALDAQLTLMDEAVVVPAEQDPVGRVRLSVVGVPPERVVDLALTRRCGAPGEATLPVAGDDPPGLTGREQALLAADVEDLRVGTEDDAVQGGVAGQLSEQSERNRGAVLERRGLRTDEGAVVQGRLDRPEHGSPRLPVAA